MVRFTYFLFASVHLFYLTTGNIGQHKTQPKDFSINQIMQFAESELAQ